MGVNLSIAPKDYFFLDGVDSRDFSVFLFKKDTLTSPARVYQRIEVPGRNGDVLIDDGRHENVEQSYGVIIMGKAYQNIVNFKNFLLSRAGRYCRLEDTFDADEYYQAHITGAITPTMLQGEDRVVCELAFDRKPQRFLKLGEEQRTFRAPSTFSQTYEQIGTLENPSYYASDPILWVWGKGTVILGDYSFEILQNMTGQPTVIDSEEQEAVYGDNIASANKNVKLHYGRFPRTSIGTNVISVSQGITRVRIQPRWWRL